MRKEEWGAFTTLIGTVVGAGILGVPYVIAKAGFLTGILALIITGAAALLMHLYLGEIILRTKGKHQLTGYAEKYLGRRGKFAMMIAMMLGIYGALIIYFIGVSNIVSVLTGIDKTIALFAFFGIVSTPIFFGIKTVERSEAYFAFVPITILVGIVAFLLPKIEPSNLVSFDGKMLFLPFGALLFAFLGTAALPEMNEVMRNKKKMKEVILAGFLLVGIVYALFTFAVVGSVGLERFESFSPNERIATIVLGSVVGEYMFILANLFGIFAMTTAFLSLGLALKEMYIYDYRMKNWLAWALTCITPLFIALGNFADFITYMGIAGTLTGGIEAVLIVMMLRNAKKFGERKPEYTVRETAVSMAAILLVFSIGLLVQFI